MKPYLTDKEIAITRAYIAMIRDTVDFFDEYIKLEKLNDKEANHAKQCYINALSKALKINEDNKQNG